MGKTTDSNLEGETLPNTGAAMTELEFDAWFTREVLPLEAALMQFLRRSYRDEGELEDVCQDAFIKVYEAARQERPKSVKPFVFAVARNIVIDRARHARIIPIEAALDLDALEIASEEPGPERTVIARDELKRLQDALDRLPKRCRVPLSFDWAGTLRGDFYWQDNSWWRVFNDLDYDRLHGYTNFNLTLILTNQNGWQVMLYDKNVFNMAAITGPFLNSDDSGLTTNVFVTDPKLIGVRVTKNW